MKIIYRISLLFFLLAVTFTVSATSEAEYGKLSKIYTLNTDGSQEFRYSMELTLFTHTAMNRLYGESFVVYNPEYQELKIHASYTKQKDGTIIKTPENAFVEVLPRQATDAPACNHLKEMVVVHTGLELGATIYLDYSVVSKPGYLSEIDICEAIAQSSPVKNYTFTITVPENKPLFYSLINSTYKPVVSTKNGMKQVSWNIHNLAAASMAPQVTTMGGDVLLLTASSYPSAEEALKKLNKQSVASVDNALQSLSKSVVKGKNNDTEKLQAILGYVVDNIGNSRLSLQETGYRVRPVNEVIRTAYATETEKIVLLTGLLNSVGITSETVAAFYNHAPINSCGLNAINEIFVMVNADGKQYFLSPKQKNMSDAARYKEYAHFLSLTAPGKQVSFETPASNLDYRFKILLSSEKVDIKGSTIVGNAFIPYTDNYLGRYTANDKEAKETKEKDGSSFNYTLSQPLKSNDGYFLLSLPEAPASSIQLPYGFYNSSRKENLLLPCKADESYRYAIQLPDSMELRTPEYVKTIDNAAGKVVLSVKQNEGLVEVVRTFMLKKQLITPSDYPDFRKLMAEWTDQSNKQLLLR